MIPENLEITALRTFVPAKDFDVSYAFYLDLGFAGTRFGPDIALLELGSLNFLLQRFYVEQHAENFMMQLTVKDLDAWWTHIQSLELAKRYGVRAPTAPAMQPWGLRITYVVDPTGVLWHIAQDRSGESTH
jgi:hypothetical protein